MKIIDNRTFNNRNRIGNSSGDCDSRIVIPKNCNSYQCVQDYEFDPCPKFEDIGNGQCDVENFNLICSFDNGDCVNR